MKNQEGDPIITDLFLSEFRADEFRKIMSEIFKDIKYCYSSLNSILSKNKPGLEHILLSHRANSLLLAMKVIKMTLKDQVRNDFQSKEMREMRFLEIERKYNESIDYVFNASRGLSYKSGYIMYDKCRSFNTARLNGLKTNNPWSADYISKLIEILNEHKYESE